MPLDVGLRQMLQSADFLCGKMEEDDFDLEAVDKALAEKSLLDFSKLSWNILEPANPFVSGWHIEAICEHLQALKLGQIRNLIINIPPRHMKSMLVGVNFPAWIWTTAPSAQFLYSSYNAELAIQDSVKCRAIVSSSWYQKFWPHVVLSDDQNLKARFENTSRGQRIATSVGGGNTGKGGDYIIADDPNNVQERESPLELDKVNNWWKETMSSRLNNLKTGRKLIIQQRVAQNDLTGAMLKEGGYEHLCLPEEYEPTRKCITSIGWSDPRIEEGELIWPERIGQPEVKSLQISCGPSGYAGQYQQRPAPRGGLRFKNAWFRKYTIIDHLEKRFIEPWEYIGSYILSGREGEVEEVPVMECTRFAIVDPAGTDKEQNDRACFTAMGIFALTPKKKLVILGVKREQLDAASGAAMIIQTCQRYNCWVGIEKNGLGLGIINKVQSAGIAVRPILAQGDKEARSETAEIRYAAGQIFHPYEGTWLTDYESELTMFPNGEFKDQVDVISYAAIYAATRTLNLKTRGSVGTSGVQ